MAELTAIILMLMMSISIGGIILLIGLVIFGVIFDFFWERSPKNIETRNEIRRLTAEMKKLKQDKKDDSIIQWFLYLDLLEYAKRNNITIKYGEEYFQKKDVSDASGYYSFYKFNGQYIKPNAIFIRKIENEPFMDLPETLGTLAHELGHHISISQYRDESEEGADVEAYKLIKQFLTEEELNNDYTSIFISVYFKPNELKDYKHPEVAA